MFKATRIMQQMRSGPKQLRALAEELGARQEAKCQKREIDLDLCLLRVRSVRNSWGEPEACVRISPKRGHRPMPALYEYTPASAGTAGKKTSTGRSAPCA